MTINTQFIAYIGLCIAMLSCNKTDDFQAPTPSFLTTNTTGVAVSIEALKGQHSLEESESITFRDTDSFITGYVISSDRFGNFYKEIILQDAPENPTAGISILMDAKALYQRYELGRKVVVRLDGLTLAIDQGVLKLGVYKEGLLQGIPEVLEAEHFSRTSVRKNLKPKEIDFSSLNSSGIHQLIQFNSMQFSEALINPKQYTYSAEKYDQFQGERDLISCSTSERIVLSTSVYASFNRQQISKNMGSISGILSKSYNGRYFILRVNGTDAIDFNTQQRCDPVVLACEAAESLEENTVFAEDFEGFRNTATIIENGWLNRNTNNDYKAWEYKKIINYNNRVLRISAFNSGLNPMEAWLVSPLISLQNVENAALKFTISTTFNNAKALSVWATNTLADPPELSNWILLPLEIPSASSNKIVLGPVPISCIGDTVYIGFKYFGRDPAATSSYELDNVFITGY